MRKLFLLLLLLCIPAHSALKALVWDGSKNTDFNDSANYNSKFSSGKVLSAGDSLIFNSGSVAAVLSANTTIGALITTTGYTGALSLNKKKLTSVGKVTFASGGSYDLVSGIIAMNGNSTVLTFAATMGVTKAVGCAINASGTGVTFVCANPLTVDKINMPITATGFVISEVNKPEDSVMKKWKDSGKIVELTTVTDSIAKTIDSIRPAYNKITPKRYMYDSLGKKIDSVKADTVRIAAGPVLSKFRDADGVADYELAKIVPIGSTLRIIYSLDGVEVDRQLIQPKTASWLISTRTRASLYTAP